MGKRSSSAKLWRAGLSVSNRSQNRQWKFGLDASCWERLIWRQAIFFGRISARKKLQLNPFMSKQ